jgi:hypothetical protein
MLSNQRLVAVTVSIAVWLAGWTNAQQTASPYNLFVGRCLSSGPNFVGTEAFAAAQDWSPLPKDVLMALTPISQPTALGGWIASGESQTIEVFVVSRGDTGGKSIEACTVGFYGINTEVFEETIASRLGTGKPGKRDAPDRVNEVFLTSSEGHDEFVTLSLPLTPERSGQAIASVLAEPWIAK